MRLHFTKMHGAGNDFVVLDATRAPLALSREQLQFLGDRRFGVGADQILVVEAAQTPAWTSATASSTAPPATRWSRQRLALLRALCARPRAERPTTIRVETVNNRLTLTCSPTAG
jgi:diaminopimelate epimerase